MWALNTEKKKKKPNPEPHTSPAPHKCRTYGHGGSIFFHLLARLFLYAYNTESHFYSYPKKSVPVFPGEKTLETPVQVQSDVYEPMNSISRFSKEHWHFVDGCIVCVKSPKYSEERGVCRQPATGRITIFRWKEQQGCPLVSEKFCK